MKTKSYFAKHTNTIYSRMIGKRRWSEELYEEEIDYLIDNMGWSYSDIDDMFSICVPDRYNPEIFIDCLIFFLTQSSKHMNSKEATAICQQLNADLYDGKYKLS